MKPSMVPIELGVQFDISVQDLTRNRGTRMLAELANMK